MIKRRILITGVSVLALSSCFGLPTSGPITNLRNCPLPSPRCNKANWVANQNPSRNGNSKLKLRGGASLDIGAQQNSLLDLYQRCRSSPAESAASCIQQIIFQRIWAILQAHAQNTTEVSGEFRNLELRETETDEDSTGPLQELLEIESRRLALENADEEIHEQSTTQLDYHGAMDQIPDRSSQIERIISQVTNLESELYATEAQASSVLSDEESDEDTHGMNEVNRQEIEQTPRPARRTSSARGADEVFERESAEHDAMGETETPSGLTTELMTHQRMALAWMKQREEQGQVSSPFWENVTLPDGEHQFVNLVTGEDRAGSNPPVEVCGGMLADDMGLGKTLTVLALIVSGLDSTAEGGGEDELDAGLVSGLKHLQLSRLYKSCVAEQQREGEEEEEEDGGQEQAALERAERSGPTLIVCPLSVLHNWQTQIAAHTDGRLRVTVYHGANRRRDAGTLGEQHIVLTTYSTLTAEYSRAQKHRRREDGGAVGSALHSVAWLRVVLDEAHVIANPKAKQSKAALMLAGRRRWAVTGTPLQNKMDDLYSLFAFLRLDPLDDLAWFQRLIKDPLKSKSAEKRNHAMALVRTVLGVYCLRRTKDQEIRGRPIVVLPRKTMLVRDLELSPPEQALYDRMFQSGKAMFRSFMRSGTVMTHYTKILTRLLRLRQLCCHPWLLPTEDEGEVGASQARPDAAEVEELVGVMEERMEAGEEECCVCLDAIAQPVITKCRHIFCCGCMEKCIAELAQRTPNAGIPCPLCRRPIAPQEVVEMPFHVTRQSDSETPADDGAAGSEKGGGEVAELRVDKGEWQSSTKLAAVLAELALVSREHPGEKVVIFSQFTSFLNILEQGLQRASTSFLRLDGTMSRERRQAAVETFQTDPSERVLLVSIKSGGTGINLVAANHVFFTDLWWNRAVEEQAMDRVHRMGQRRPVRVVRFVTKGTIEERIVELQEKKAAMIRGAMGGASSGRLQHARTADLQMLFR